MDKVTVIFHKMEYSAIKGNKSIIHVTTSENLKTIILSKRKTKK